MYTALGESIARCVLLLLLLLAARDTAAVTSHGVRATHSSHDYETLSGHLVQ
jgi:hypothetical protein